MELVTSGCLSVVETASRKRPDDLRKLKHSEKRWNHGGDHFFQHVFFVTPKYTSKYRVIVYKKGRMIMYWNSPFFFVVLEFNFSCTCLLSVSKTLKDYNRLRSSQRLIGFQHFQPQLKAILNRQS